MKVIIKNSTAEIVEKKSRFIANLFYVSNIGEAEKKLSEIKKLHYDAKHNCYVYILGVTGETKKSSDDGEPSGTAGHPMLDILNGNNLTNCIAIVTRYFGGILLGTGGLVRCYSESLKMAVANAIFSDIISSYNAGFDISYDDYGKLEKYINDYNLKHKDNDKTEILVVDKKFEERVLMNILIPVASFDKIKVDFSNLSRGKIAISNDDLKNYFVKDKEICYI